MFHPLGLFKNISCPKPHDCNLQNCIFGHDVTEDHDAATGGRIYDPLDAGGSDSPPLKKRRIDAPNVEAQNLSASAEATAIALPSQRPRPNGTLVEAKSKNVGSVKEPKSQPTKPVKVPGQRLIPTSAKRSISPPTSTPQQQVPVLTKTEKLIPRPVAQAPATLKARMSLVEHLYKHMNTLNLQLISDDPGSKELVPGDQQVIRWVLDEEEQAATKLTGEIYRNAMSQKVLQLKRMKPEDWKNFIKEKLYPATPAAQKPNEPTTGLHPHESIQILRYLRTNLTGLDSHGYVTKPPSESDISKAKEAIKAAAGFELCDRCGVRFQVFPGRDIQGRLTTKGECHYHWAKLHRGQWHKTDYITGQSQASFPCCGRSPGSDGCTQAATHVFKVSDVKRLAALLQFEQTPAKTDGASRPPVAFDCEMAYTTYGMEVVRVTAVSWPDNRELLDVLVRPFGEILDLNTRFSGVTQEQFAKALPYDTASDGNTTIPEAERLENGLLRKVDSPQMARQLMFDILGPETPLIGHAIDNDLNTCRIIHPFVIDTVLLYPHPRGLPIRFGLKTLTSKYLHRSIQAGGETGHDSKEDSIATGDLVKIKVAEKWQTMRLQGWKFHAGSLIPPGRL